MVETKDAKDVEENVALSEPMVFICADNASERKPKRWDLKNIHRRLKEKC
jgi:hypothetical protein